MSNDQHGGGRRDANASAESTPDRDYRVICISTYDADLEALDKMVAELKQRGIRKANRSWLIRLALARLDLDTVTEADRP